MGSYDKAVNALIKRHHDELSDEIRTLYKSHGREVIVDVTYDVNVYPVREVGVQEARKAFEKALEG
jgi:hypothetical protein